MPVHEENGVKIWKLRTTQAQWLRYAGWFFLVALFVVTWQIMTKNTIWFFVYDAGTQAVDLATRAWPPKWEYADEKVLPVLLLFDHVRPRQRQRGVRHRPGGQLDPVTVDMLHVRAVFEIDAAFVIRFRFPERTTNNSFSGAGAVSSAPN